MKVNDVGQMNYMCHQVGGEATSTPTESTRRHANVACAGCSVERMRELEDQDTRQEGREGGNKCFHQGNEDSMSRLHQGVGCGKRVHNLEHMESE